jgi:hypothetical protein
VAQYAKRDQINAVVKIYSNYFVSKNHFAEAAAHEQLLVYWLGSIDRHFTNGGLFDFKQVFNGCGRLLKHYFWHARLLTPKDLKQF